MVPKKIFFTKGVGVHKDKLQSFELALRAAGIAKCNLVNVSSIFPPGCQMISKEEGKNLLKPGQITYCVMARNATDEPNRLVAAAIGVAIPADGNSYGYISEHTSFGQVKEVAGEYAEDLAASMLASTLGIPFDPNEAWNARQKMYRMSRRIVGSYNTTQTARGDKNGKWTTVIAAAVFVTEDEEEQKPEQERYLF
jgi:arginine decarboxylase